MLIASSTVLILLLILLTMKIMMMWLVQLLAQNASLITTHEGGAYLLCVGKYVFGVILMRLEALRKTQIKK